MNCEQVKEHLSAYLDNALSPEERQYVAAHVQTCTSCQQMLSEFTRFDALLANLPRISPKPVLRERIFSSQEYLELMGHLPDISTDFSPDKKRSNFSRDRSRPHFVSLPGGRQAPETHALRKTTVHKLPIPYKKSFPSLGQRILYGIIAVSVLLTLGIGGLISWRLWIRQEYIMKLPGAITPPAFLPQQGPLPAGTRFLFLRDGSLWSCADDGSSITRLTPENVTVGIGWTIRAGFNGHHAGNQIAYVDTQQGLIHIVRSDGQNDITLPQPLIPKNVQAANVWQTASGVSLLTSLSWSPDGSTLAFVGGDLQRPHFYLFHLAGTIIQQIEIPFQGVIKQLTWSPDNKRIAFTVTKNGIEDIDEYNLENRESSSVVKQVNSSPYLHDSVLSLHWSLDSVQPVLTWSVGSIGHIHSLWSKQVGINPLYPPLLLKAGDYIQASYNQAIRPRWFFITAPAGIAGDIYTVGLNTLITRQTIGREATSAEWSPDGRFITYLDTFTSNTGILHVVDTQTQLDTRLASGVASTPMPSWSSNRQELAYSTGSHIFVIDKGSWKHPYALKLQGHVTALSWSNSNPARVILALSDTHEGLYLIDSHTSSIQQVDTAGTQGELQWSEIP